MQTRRRRRTLAVTAALAPVTALATAMLPPSSALATPQVVDNACVNNLVSTQASLIPVTMDGTASPSPVAPGGTITLSGISASASVPPQVFLTGYGLGFLTTGLNNVPATVTGQIVGLNTVEGMQTTNVVNTVATTTITDPTPLNPSSGDETATPGTVLATFADETWTAGQGGTMSFAERAVHPASGTDPAGMNITASVGPGGIITARFACSPGSVVEGASPSTIVWNDSPAAFATTSTPNQAPVCTNKTVSVKHATKLTISLPCTDADGQTVTRSIVTPPAHGTLGAVSSTGTVAYTPKSNYGGTDSFTFKGDDGNGGTSNTATVTLKIAAGKTGLTLSASATKVKTGSKVRLKGRLQDLTTKQYLNGQRIYLQRRSGTSGSWTTVTSKLTATVSGKRGVVVFSVTVKRSFYYHLRYKGSAAYRASTSRAVHVVAT